MLSLKLVLANPIKDFFIQAKEALSGRNVSLFNSTEPLSNLGELFTKVEPSVLIVGPDWDINKVLLFAPHFSAYFPYVAIILVVRSLNKELLQCSIEAGIKDVIELPLRRESFFSSIEAAARFCSAVQS